MLIGELIYKLQSYPDHYEVRILYPANRLDEASIVTFFGEIKEVGYDSQIDTFVTIEVE